ncbi:MAG: MoaD/ThiS family protein [Firmicutes bacterium]|nr:MoaD/ThiS family protein [Bacillota bacterium]
MEVIVKADATIRQRIPNYPGESGMRLSLSQPATVLDLLALLAIPPQEVGLVLINGTFSQKETALQPNDVVQLFSFIEGG